MQANTIDNDWMAVAIEMAKAAEASGEVPVGAVLVDKDNQLIAKAHNRCIQCHDPSAHAEIEVLRQAGTQLHNYRLPETTLYVTLEPCPMCTGALIHARVGRVVFAARDFRTGACGSVFDLHAHDALNHRMRVDFVENEAYIALLKGFFKARR